MMDSCAVLKGSKFSMEDKLGNNKISGKAPTDIIWWTSI